MTQDKKALPTFEDIVDEATRQIHTALLEGGGKAMKAKVHTYLSYIIQWNQEYKTDDK